MDKHPWTEDDRCVVDTILQYKKQKGGTVVFDDDCTKCQMEWDRVVAEIVDTGREKFKLDVAYARMGEELEDHDFDQGENVYICYKLSLCPPKFHRQKRQG